MDDKLKPCPFCGGVAQRVDIPADEHDPNAGGSYIACQFCLASSSIAFGDKSSLVDNWNSRAGDARIRAEARAEADTKIAYWKRWVSGLCERIEEQWPRDCDASQEANAARAAILADEPKEEREAEVGDIVTWTNSHGARMIGIFGREITQGDATVLMRRVEVERRIEEAGR